MTARASALDEPRTRTSRSEGFLANRRGAARRDPAALIGREDFIAMKVAAGDPIDLLDAENAIAAGPKSLDLELVRKLGLRFGTSAAALLERMLGDLGLGRQ
jgi:hypothetical protein